IGPFLERVRAEVPHATIWIYSGYTWEELTDPGNDRCRCEWTDRILSMIDILVDGEFVEALKDITLNFRGSSNQRIIDVKKTLKDGNIVLSGLNN
ncbi:MAG: 4Fe-4S single cluster domain-containing protein, partial [Oscillospiraceae bacterium]